MLHRWRPHPSIGQAWLGWRNMGEAGGGDLMAEAKQEAAGVGCAWVAQGILSRLKSELNPGTLNLLGKP